MNILLDFINTKQEEKEKSNTDIFKLPIYYLENSKIHTLNETVVTDLELESTTEKKTMYHYLLKPKHEFAEKMIPQWKNSFTTDTHFLKESQEIIQSMDTYTENMKGYVSYDLSYNNIMEIWKDTKENPHFLEHYSYIEIEFFKQFNKNPVFLQAISVINMGSPILSFLIPFVFFILPFIILKIQRVPISFSVYLSVLKEISRNHFIGKILNNTENMSLNSIVYLFMTLGLYIYQIYQNYVACTRFYKNITKINNHIYVMKQYVSYSITSMTSFYNMIKEKSSYDTFSKNLNKHIENLRLLYGVLSSIQPFSPSFSKIGEIGNLLSCYYELHSNIEYERALLYSFSFEGYINNLLGIFENLNNQKVAFTTYDISCDLVIKDQYYPALIEDEYIVNPVILDKNMVITGPNASGKTTYLKTTTLNIIFSQQIGCGFFSSCTLHPYSHIHSYLNIPDTSGRDSLFQAESRRCKEIIDGILKYNIEYRHFCIFDELYSGTNPMEATKTAYAFLLYLSQFENVDFILTTHYVSICSRLNKSKTIRNWKMNCDESENGDIKYNYTIAKGVSKIQGAIKVLKDMEYPEEILKSIHDYDSKK